MYKLARGATAQEIHHLLELDLANTSGSGIKYKNSYNHRQVVGSMAGSSTGKYYQVMLNGKNYYTHQLVLLLVGRKGIKEVRKGLLVVDHINDGTYPYYSNHPNNLRITTQRTNVMYANQSTKGTMLLPSGNWRATIKLLGKQHTSTHSTQQQAIAWRSSMYEPTA